MVEIYIHSEAGASPEAVGTQRERGGAGDSWHLGSLAQLTPGQAHKAQHCSVRDAPHQAAIVTRYQARRHRRGTWFCHPSVL